MTITLRQESATGASTKGSSLTYSELDNNFIDLLNGKIQPLQVNADSGQVTVGQAQSNGVLRFIGGTGIATTVVEDSAGNADVTIDFDGSDANTTYTINAAADGSNVNFNLAGNDASTDTIQFVAGSNITLSTDSAGAITIAATDTGITDIVQDTTPQLGGTLDGQGNEINNVILEDYKETIYTGGSTTGTITPDVVNGNVQSITLSGNITFNAFANPETGQSMTLIVKQPASGGPYTLTSTMKFAGGTKTLSTAANAIDIISIVYDGTNYYASLGTNFS
ncbi:hypothetical protein [Phage DSL-LC06]|nr:hypothetical protein [Phage DSL-LC06]